jgi:ribosomal protein S18 acetylase RimI-like enzyme
VTSSPSAGSLRRLPFAPGDVDAVIAFCVAHGGVYDAALTRYLLLELTSDPAGVIVIGDGDGPTLAATVVDRARNGADAASLETLGVRAPIAAAPFTRLVIEPAVAFARAGERRALHVALPPTLLPAEGAENALRDAGFAHAYDTFAMRRPASAPSPASPEALPAGWSWAALNGSRVDEAHAALVEIFRDAPSTNLRPLEEFREAVVSGASRWHVLLDGGRLAGLVQIALHGAGGAIRGEVRTIGRVPTYRGRGVGPRLVAEGLRLLREGGAGDVDLAVEADNERALDLYRRFAFEVVTRTPVFALPLR